MNPFDKDWTQPAQADQPGTYHAEREPFTLDTTVPQTGGDGGPQLAPPADKTNNDVRKTRKELWAAAMSAFGRTKPPEPITREEGERLLAGYKKQLAALGLSQGFEGDWVAQLQQAQQALLSAKHQGIDDLGRRRRGETNQEFWSQFMNAPLTGFSALRRDEGRRRLARVSAAVGRAKLDGGEAAATAEAEAFLLSTDVHVRAAAYCLPQVTEAMEAGIRSLLNDAGIPKELHGVQADSLYVLHACEKMFQQNLDRLYAAFGVSREHRRPPDTVGYDWRRQKQQMAEEASYQAELQREVQKEMEQAAVQNKTMNIPPLVGTPKTGASEIQKMWEDAAGRADDADTPIVVGGD